MRKLRAIHVKKGHKIDCFVGTRRVSGEVFNSLQLNDHSIIIEWKDNTGHDQWNSFPLASVFEVKTLL